MIEIHIVACVLNVPFPNILGSNSTLVDRSESAETTGLQASRQMLFIIGLFVSFVCITLFAVWIIARRRKLGNYNNTQHTDLEYSKLMSRC